MLFLKKLAGFLYFLIMFVSGGVFICVALDVFSPSFLSGVMDTVRMAISARIAVGVAGALILITGMIVLVRSRKLKGNEKLITFQNPDGEVTVSISAIESYVKRVARDIPGITDVKAVAKVGKKGIAITSFVAVSAGTNIPEVTENIQMTVKSKVQDMLGVEERITVTMHIVKILKEDETSVCEGKVEDKSAAPPFREME